MSKCQPNWQRLPNSRMDRQHRPRQFFRQKDRVEGINRLIKKEQEQRERGKFSYE